MTQRIVIVGGGFAGVWSALAAAAEARRQGASAQTEITLYSPGEHLVIRPRLYESDLAGALVPLHDLLAPVRVKHVAEAVTDLQSLDFDQLVICAGSQRLKPLNGEAEFGVDSHAEALALKQALDDHEHPVVAVVGASFTGIEAAAELAATAEVHLFDRGAVIAPGFGPKAREVIVEALTDLGVQLHPATEGPCAGSAEYTGPGPDLTLWTTTLRANPLTAQLGVPLDPQGRVFTDRSLHTEVDGVWAAGDVARVTVDGVNDAPMSCQHATPQGVVAGGNAVRAALGKEPKAYQQPMYLTCLDLGAAGALLTTGFARDEVLASGQQGKQFKRWINRSLIYPPASRKASQLMKLGSAPTPGPRAARFQQRALRHQLIRRQLTRSAQDRAALFAERAGAGPGLG